MMLAFLRRPVPHLAALAVMLGSACNSTVTSPTRQTSSPPPPVTSVVSSPTSTGLSPFAGTWNVSLALSDVVTHTETTSCVLDALKSQIGVPRDYTLTVTEQDVTVTDTSNNFSCTFETVKGNGTGFTTENVTGYFRCNGKMPVRCADGSAHELMWLAQNITATVAGTDISGTWYSFWYFWGEPVTVRLTSQFSGRKQ